MAMESILPSGGEASVRAGRTSTDRDYVLIIAFRPGFINGQWSQGVTFETNHRIAWTQPMPQATGALCQDLRNKTIRERFASPRCSTSLLAQDDVNTGDLGALLDHRRVLGHAEQVSLWIGAGGPLDVGDLLQHTPLVRGAELDQASDLPCP